MDTQPLCSLEIAAGSIPGREHLRTGRDNQDSYAFLRSEHALVGVVCDGCGSMPFSGLGAHLGARLLIRSLSLQLSADPDRDAEALVRIAQSFLVRRLSGLARDLTPAGLPHHPTSLRRFLFTVVGFLVRPQETILFGCGDGVFSINGERHVLGPFPGNRPPYLAYRFLPEVAEDPDLEILTRIPTGELRHLVIGTDGLSDWLALDSHPEVPSPGDTLSHPSVTRNPDFLRRRLTVAQRRGGPGALPDDTTLVMIRRAEA